ncbi:hypothetical protein KR093_010056 [Drosophila rubida]|uniref:Uncharacterized protein n=1 Tax=Drosophila rubida TaxID=30044 RepID=A0AAD4PIX1_9MUSC|nr:hypothetical protein KR093_010056 [Drosophila rubida]
MASEACTVEMKHAVYETLWQQWQQDKQIYDPLKILDFYRQLEQQANVSTTLRQKIYQAFVSRTSQLLSAPFHTDSRCAEFPQVTSLLIELRQIPDNYTRDIIETLFDDVLSSESTLSVAQRLDNLNASLTQQTMAKLQLLHRVEVHVNSSVHIFLMDNLRQLSKQPTFMQELDIGLQNRVRRSLLPGHDFHPMPLIVCLRKTNNINYYLSECENISNMCIQKRHPAKTPFKVRHAIVEEQNQSFTFQSPYWDKRYLTINSTLQLGAEITRNVYSRRDINWLHVIHAQDGVAIYDAIYESIICAGDPQQRENDEFLAYTRLVEDFDAHRDDCTWTIEDCSNL